MSEPLQFARPLEPLTLTGPERASLLIVIRNLSRPRGDVEVSMVDAAIRLLETGRW